MSCPDPSAIATTVSTSSSKPEAAQGTRVVLLSIDGLRPAMLLHPEAFGLSIPNLNRLRREGAVAEGMKTVFPSLTYPAHVTMVTGVAPALHGIDNNFVLDPEGDNKDGWHWYAERIRTPTLWRAVAGANKRVASVYFPVTLGADIRWNIPQFWRAENKEDERLLSLLIEPELRNELKEHAIALPGEHTKDHERALAAAYLLKEKDPDLLLAYFEDLDTKSHKHGPNSPEAKATLEQIDAELGRLLAAGSARPTLWIIVSDHGFAESTQWVKPGVILKKLGLLGRSKNDKLASPAVKTKTANVSGPTAGTASTTPDEAKKDKPRVIVARSNGMFAVYPATQGDDEAIALARREFERLAKVPKSGIGRVYSAEELRSKQGYPGAGFAVEAAPGHMFIRGSDGSIVTKADEAGAHGYDPDRPEMQATFLAYGAGVSPGIGLGHVNITQVAPTVLRAMGLEIPKEMQGAPITIAAP
jgi:predicted AlkP superfamily pyrophosphatase or phosphodiesterase